VCCNRAPVVVLLPQLSIGASGIEVASGWFPIDIFQLVVLAKFERCVGCATA
jgi:hypothetical protein